MLLKSCQDHCCYAHWSAVWRTCTTEKECDHILITRVSSILMSLSVARWWEISFHGWRRIRDLVLSLVPFFLHQFAGFLRALLSVAHLLLWPHLSAQAVGQGCLWDMWHPKWADHWCSLKWVLFRCYFRWGTEGCLGQRWSEDPCTEPFLSDSRETQALRLTTHCLSSMSIWSPAAPLGQLIRLFFALT